MQQMTMSSQGDEDTPKTKKSDGFNLMLTPLKESLMCNIEILVVFSFSKSTPGVIIIILIMITVVTITVIGTDHIFSLAPLLKKTWSQK